jgi:hypothetical protein
MPRLVPEAVPKSMFHEVLFLPSGECPLHVSADPDLGFLAEI